MQKWEYRRILIAWNADQWMNFGERNWQTGADNMIRDLGEQGWEMVAAGGSGNSGSLFFKRRKE